jgi:hypothetical protein
MRLSVLVMELLRRAKRKRLHTFERKVWERLKGPFWNFLRIHPHPRRRQFPKSSVNWGDAPKVDSAYPIQSSRPESFTVWCRLYNKAGSKLLIMRKQTDAEAVHTLLSEIAEIRGELARLKGGTLELAAPLRKPRRGLGKCTGVILVALAVA